MHHDHFFLIVGEGMGEDSLTARPSEIGMGRPTEGALQVRYAILQQHGDHILKFGLKLCERRYLAELSVGTHI